MSSRRRMKDRTQELRSVSLGMGKMGGGTPIFGERVGVEWVGAGMWGQLEVGGRGTTISMCAPGVLQ